VTSQERRWPQPLATSASFGNCPREGKVCDWSSRQWWICGHMWTNSILRQHMLWQKIYCIRVYIYIYYTYVYMTCVCVCETATIENLNQTRKCVPELNCARWTSPLVQQAEHWCVCESRLVLLIVAVIVVKPKAIRKSTPTKQRLSPGFTANSFKQTMQMQMQYLALYHSLPYPLWFGTCIAPLQRPRSE